ncbi:hypothetical protein LRD69_17735 [Streptomyces sp. JH14]|uniref:hypothetical protein n=1 Tax=Streptomyces sp. JH14 TaxID=2793630 RepID=UPI0023FA3473|nr:hypothetical protein [Streptomyces sp. JH14]MDF6043939.1 hypothetical protein [Streptomyces sp. JH14]
MALTVATAAQASADFRNDPGPAGGILVNTGHGNVFNFGNENTNSAAGRDSQVDTGHASGGGTLTSPPTTAQDLRTTTVDRQENVPPTPDGTEFDTLNLSCPAGWQVVSGAVSFSGPSVDGIPAPSHPEFLLGSHQLNSTTWQFNYRIPAEPDPVFMDAQAVCARTVGL